MEIRLQSNIKEFTRELTAIQKQQVPYATSRAINDTAVNAQDDVIEAIPSIFKNRRKWWLKQQPTGIKVKFSNKMNLHAQVRTAAPFAEIQEKGGTRRARRKNLAIPKKENVLDKFERAGSAHLLLNDKKQYFKTDKAIYRRLRNGHLKYMYALSYAAKILPRFHFFATCKAAVMRRFETNFKMRLSQALATAKRPSR